MMVFILTSILSSFFYIIMGVFNNRFSVSNIKHKYYINVMNEERIRLNNLNIIRRMISIFILIVMLWLLIYYGNKACDELLVIVNKLSEQEVIKYLNYTYKTLIVLIGINLTITMMFIFSFLYELILLLFYIVRYKDKKHLD